MEWLHKLFEHCANASIMGYNDVLLLVVSGELVFPVGVVVLGPKSHADSRSKNDIIREEITELKAICDAHEVSLEEVELLGDSAYCRPKVVLTAINVGLRGITKPGLPHKFECEGEHLTPKESIERVKGRYWKVLEAEREYHRVVVSHHPYGEVVLIVRRRRLKNQKVMSDVLVCTKRFYPALRIHRSCTTRWRIELEFKYHKQYLGLGKGQCGKWGSIRSQLACVALAG